MKPSFFSPKGGEGVSADAASADAGEGSKLKMLIKRHSHLSGRCGDTLPSLRGGKRDAQALGGEPT